MLVELKLCKIYLLHAYINNAQMDIFVALEVSRPFTWAHTLTHTHTHTHTLTHTHTHTHRIPAFS